MRVEKSVDGARRWTRCVTMMDDDARAHRVVHLKQFKCRGCSEGLDKLIQHCITVHFCSSPNDSAWITWLRSFWIRGACRAQLDVRSSLGDGCWLLALCVLGSMTSSRVVELVRRVDKRSANVERVENRQSATVNADAEADADAAVGENEAFGTPL